MGFLDKAKAAATDLAAKADTALASSGLTGPKPPGGGDAEKLFRDLGVLAYLESTGRPVDQDERQRVTVSLQDLESRGAVTSFALHTAPPPAPGVGAAGPGWPSQPAAPAAPPPPPAAGLATPPPPPAVPTAPPPPSWMTTDGGSGS
ncbi:MAG TPA: hypothetical protein VMV41_06990 [Cellulomonadaceae bacterium]|nr:hypothetical protein [Cellulomonadaceae bacterium]